MIRPKPLIQQAKEILQRDHGVDVTKNPGYAIWEQDAQKSLGNGQRATLPNMRNCPKCVAENQKEKFIITHEIACPIHHETLQYGEL